MNNISIASCAVAIPRFLRLLFVCAFGWLLSVGPTMSQVSRTNQRPGLDETAQQELKWLVSGKGMRPQALPKRSTTPSIDRFDPEETGSAETPKKYFEGWYGRDAEWAPELQRSAFEHGQTVNKEARRER